MAPRRSWLWCKSPLYVEGPCKPSLSSEMGSEPFTACHLWSSRDLFPNCCDGVCAILRSGVSATQFEILFMKSSRWQSTSNIGCCQRERGQKRRLHIKSEHSDSVFEVETMTYWPQKTSLVLKKQGLRPFKMTYLVFAVLCFYMVFQTFYKMYSFLHIFFVMMKWLAPRGKLLVLQLVMQQHFKALEKCTWA